MIESSSVFQDDLQLRAQIDSFEKTSRQNPRSEIGQKRKKIPNLISEEGLDRLWESSLSEIILEKRMHPINVELARELTLNKGK